MARVHWAIFVWLAAVPGASADDMTAHVSPSSPSVTPLDLSPPPRRSDAKSDLRSLGTAPPAPMSGTAPHVSRLDFSSPPLSDLPPEAPPPAVEAPALSEGVSATPHPENDSTRNASERLPGSSDPTSDPRAPAIAVAIPDTSPSTAEPAPERRIPSQTSEPQTAPFTGLPDADGAASGQSLAIEIQAATEGFLAGPVIGQPIGAGDWKAARAEIASVYASRNFAPLWIEDGKWSASAKSVLDRLSKAGEDGLDLRALPIPNLPQNSDDRNRAQADVALSALVVAYAMQASGARINPRLLSKDVSAKPDIAEPGNVLKNVSKATDAGSALAASNPPQKGYRELRAALASLRSEPAQSLARFSPGPVLTLGMSDPRVPLIRARFRFNAVADSTAAEIYDVKVASAVAAFQRIHGLRADGSLTQATASALDDLDIRAQRERSILANMEIWRWEPRDMGEFRVEVNVPDFSLRVMEGDKVIHRARVIVGKAETPTPIFSNSIKYLLFNPVWHVPDSIVRKEMQPKLEADPNYLTRHGYKVSYVGDKMEVEQPPGEANALGRMLFLFPNEHAVYMHDTPLRSLFGASYRALSHGCVRVEQPDVLAEIVMGGAARGWTGARAQSLIGDKERTFSLPTPIPVHLEYFTTFVENDALREREDVYGLAHKVAAALAALRRD